MDAKQKFNLVYNLTKTIMEQRTLYSDGCQFIDNNLSDPSVIKAFATLTDKLQQQLDKIRKQCK